jgi:Tfp pilus assembly protein PilP
MKRKLAFLLFLTFTVAAVAQTPTVTTQTPTVVEKPAPKTTVSPAKPAAQTKAASSKPSPVTVKVGAVTPQKPAATAAKPAVVAAQRTAVKPVAVPAKTVAVSSVKASPTPAPKVGAVPGVKTNQVLSAKPVAVAKPMPQSTPAANSGRPMVAAPMARASAPSKSTAVAVKSSAAPKAVAPQAKTKDPFSAGKKVQAVTAKSTTVAVHDTKAETKKPESKKISAAGRRDPFISPVVAMGAIGSGCSSGKRCLAIDQIALKGVVRSDNGMIAVVVNAMDKAYFLRENDPVFNGYVVKITGDSIVFKETFKDKLGKPLTRDVTKSISRPVA